MPAQKHRKHSSHPRPLKAACNIVAQLKQYDTVTLTRIAEAVNEWIRTRALVDWGPLLEVGLTDRQILEEAYGVRDPWRAAVRPPSSLIADPLRAHVAAISRSRDAVAR